MPKKIMMIILLLLSSFIAIFYQWTLFSSSEPIPYSYLLIILFIDTLIIGMMIIVFDYIFQKEKS